MLGILGVVPARSSTKRYGAKLLLDHAVSNVVQTLAIPVLISWKKTPSITISGCLGACGSVTRECWGWTNFQVWLKSSWAIADNPNVSTRSTVVLSCTQ